jgi:hypothetical protein
MVLFYNTTSPAWIVPGWEAVVFYGYPEIRTGQGINTSFKFCCKYERRSNSPSYFYEAETLAGLAFHEYL